MAGSLYLRFTTGGVQAASANQWAPDLASHDPNPPLSLESWPCAQYDWPNPRGRDFALELRTFVQPTITSRAPLVLRAPFVVPYWPRSFAVAIGAQAAQQIPPAPVAAPFAAPAWPNPAAVSWPAELRTWIAAPQLQVAVADAPVVPADWPVPRARVAQPLWDAPNLLESTLAPAAVVMPFAQSEWPNPQRPGRHGQPTHVARRTAPNVGDPVRPVDFPNPQAPRSDVRGDALNLLASTLGQAPAAPVKPIDWPLPGRATHPIALLTWTIGPRAPADQLFGEPGEAPGFEWPTPPARRTPNLYGTWSDRPLALSLPSQDPLRPPEMPLPGRAEHPIALRTWSVNLLEGTLSLPVGVPLRPVDMPVPRAAFFPVSERGFINWASPQNVPPSTAVVIDWLVRARHRGGR